MAKQETFASTLYRMAFRRVRFAFVNKVDETFHRNICSTTVLVGLVGVFVFEYGYNRGIDAVWENHNRGVC
jgi:hypothetical protein